ncbi:MAG: hypothetical protein MZW92_14730 [Comamonadaceae bacterium]|nr:hypothetical protein [Comamonadaceae bacterium]
MQAMQGSVVRAGAGSGFAESRSPAAIATERPRRRLPPRQGRRGPGRRRPVGSPTPASTSASRAEHRGRRLPRQPRCPSNLRRRLDVTDFGTPVTSTSTPFEQGDNARMMIDAARARGNTTPTRRDNQFVLEVKPVVEDPNKLVQGTRRRLPGREAVAQLPERRRPRGAAGHRRLHRPQHHHQRLGAAAASRCG